MKNSKGKIKYIIAAILVICIIASTTLYVIFFPLKYYDTVKKYANEYNLEPLRVMAIIKAESNFNKQAKSMKNAYGLMQITESTAKWAKDEMGINYNGVNDLKDEDYNIKMGCWYLDYLRKEFGRWDLIIASYNGGPGNVKKWLNNDQYSKSGTTLDNIPFSETDKYVKKVNTNYKIYKLLYKK